ncbi:MAG TPA: thioredoxin domain-containing protein [Desulfuromonadales bacterium]|nr:thioredoxin domain-containing protein [Desulfuromonadales bacterium]
MTNKLDTAAYIAELMAIDTTLLPADGGERFNRLIFARSPYLLQHAENPVAWYQWGAEAFEAAQSGNRPILLSIGYATCHWCHVMAHESFEDRDVAALLNRHFICVKVDREERPDIDDFYMTVSQTMNGNGGWPLNIFMTPDKRPFMAVTYLPKRNRGGMSGLMELSENIATIWRDKTEMIENNCRAIMEALNTARPSATEAVDPDLIALETKTLQQLQRIYDRHYGGFGRAPKFPMPIYLSWLIGQHCQLPQQDNTSAVSPLQMALQTVRKMRAGGIWDHLAGGLHRYSVDQIWLAPHFEKMLYDQAMLSQVALEAFQASRDTTFLDLAAEIFSFVGHELQSPQGAFCSALDADSEGVEGKFYLWDTWEIEESLGAEADLFCRFYNISPEGNFEGRTILTEPQDVHEFYREENRDAIATGELLQHCRSLLLKRRAGRIRPLRDDKIITSWNGLMIASLAKGGILCGQLPFVADAARAATFILENLRRSDGRLLRSYLNGASDTLAFLEDYAFLGNGLLELYEATLNQEWLQTATALTDDLLRLFRDPVSGEFTLTGCDAEQMPLRVSSDHDGVTPSALASSSRLLLRLGWTLDRADLLDAADAALSGCRTDLQHNPLGHLGALQVMRMRKGEPVVATLNGSAGTPEMDDLLQTLATSAIAGLVIKHVASQAPASVAICANQTCYPAVSNAAKLTDLLVQTGVIHETGP